MIIPDKSAFKKAVQIIIDKLEGGYFHPNMYVNNPGRFSMYGKSGETLYGLDRHAGHDLFYSSKRKEADPVKDLPNSLS